MSYTPHYHARYGATDIVTALDMRVIDNQFLYGLCTGVDVSSSTSRLKGA